MRLPLAFKCAVLSVSCLGLALPQSAVMATQPESGSPGGHQTLRIADVALGPQGTIRGKVVDHQGIGLPASRVVLRQGQRQVALTTTDAQGHFVAANIRSGVYTVAAARNVGIYRLWPSHSAPPSASQGVLIVADGRTVRGQGTWYDWVSEHYVITYVGIAAAIAVPTALVHASHHRAPASP